MKEKKCIFCEKGVKDVDYKDEILKNFLSERGKILRSEITGTCSKHQRKLTRAIKRARNLAILPFEIK